MRAAIYDLQDKAVDNTNLLHSRIKAAVSRLRDCANEQIAAGIPDGINAVELVGGSWRSITGEFQSTQGKGWYKTYLRASSDQAARGGGGSADLHATCTRALPVESTRCNRRQLAKRI